MTTRTSRVKARALAAWLLSSCSVHCAAAELIPTLQGGTVGLEIRGLQLPDTLRTDLVSGLTNRILIRIALLSDREAVAHHAVAIAIKYDLWEETFGMTTSVDERPVDVRSLPSVEAVLAVLADLSISGVLQSSDLALERPYMLQADVLFDPVDRERMEKIRQWVAQNSTLPTNGTPVGGGGASRSAELFNRIFEQYAAGADVAAAWRELVVSQPFRLDTLGAPPSPR
jgi:hypothetical protein